MFRSQVSVGTYCLPVSSSRLSSTRMEVPLVTAAVAVEAKRILLRYGAPIAVLDEISDSERVELARTVSRTPLSERERKLRVLLKKQGYLTSD